MSEHARIQLPVARPIAAPAATAPRKPSAAASATTARAKAAASDAIEAGDTTALRDTELQAALAAQAARFDAMMKVLAEQQREINTIVDLGMAQTKRDDQITSEWIRLI